MADLDRCAQSGKVCFNKRDAETKRNHRQKRSNDKMRAYQCESCNWWHLTHAGGYHYGKRK